MYNGSARGAGDQHAPMSRPIEAGGGSAVLACELYYDTGNGGSGSLARSVLPLSISPTAWPAWSDAIIVSDDGSMFSSQRGWGNRRNGSDALEAACAACFGSFPCGEGFLGLCGLEDALAIPAVVALAVADVWGGEPPPNAVSTTGPPFM